MGRRTRIFFATDIHGSERCFLKFLNAAKVYKTDTLILGGDITGKMLVPIVSKQDGSFVAEIPGERYTAKSPNELADLEKRIRSFGYYPYPTTEDQMARLREDPAGLDTIFDEVMIKTLQGWIRIAEERLSGTNVRLYVTGGNDDRLEIEDVLKQSDVITDPEGEVVDINGGYSMLSSGWSNPTPWKTPRECSEDELEAKIEEMAAEVQDMKKCIFNLHVPPYDSGLDSCPKLDENLKPVYAGSEIVMAPAGSKACRNAIEKHQPALGLHGHIHESRGFSKIGKTLCLNPGSEYIEGMLRGALVDLDEKGVVNYLLTAG